MKAKKRVGILGIIALIVGLFTLGMGIKVQWDNHQFMKEAETAEAFIEDIVVSEKSTYSYSEKKHRTKTSHEVYVSYEIDGIVYDNVSLNYYSSGMQEGDTIKIYYNPENPREILADGSQFAGILITGLLGFVFTVVGVCFVASYVKFLKKRKLMITGTCIKLPIVEKRVNKHVRVNGQYGCYVVCAKEDSSSNLQRVYKSDTYYDSEFNSRYDLGDLVSIYIDPQNADKYFMDMEHVESNVTMRQNDYIQ